MSDACNEELSYTRASNTYVRTEHKRWYMTVEQSQYARVCVCRELARERKWENFPLNSIAVAVIVDASVVACSRIHIPFIQHIAVGIDGCKTSIILILTHFLFRKICQTFWIGLFSYFFPFLFPTYCPRVQSAKIVIDVIEAPEKIVSFRCIKCWKCILASSSDIEKRCRASIIILDLPTHSSPFAIVVINPIWFGGIHHFPFPSYVVGWVGEKVKDKYCCFRPRIRGCLSAV